MRVFTNHAVTGICVALKIQLGILIALRCQKLNRIHVDVCHTAYKAQAGQHHKTVIFTVFMVLCQHCIVIADGYDMIAMPVIQ